MVKALHYFMTPLLLHAILSLTVMRSDEEIHRKRNWVAMIGTLIALGLIALFVWRILYFTKQIQSGQLDPSTFDFDGTFSSSLRLSAMPISETPIDVVSTDDPSLGRKDAPLTVVEFADFYCPYSRESSFTMRELAIKYPEKFQYIYRDFPIAEIHPLAQKAAEAAECAADQGQFWQYHDKLYQNQYDLSLERFRQFAGELNLNETVFRNCLDDGTQKEEIQKDYADGLAAGVRGTPTFFLNGAKVDGAIPKSLLEQWILSVETQ